MKSPNPGLPSCIPIRTDADDDLSTIHSSSSSGLFAANRRDNSDKYASYISSEAWKTNPARLAELKASGHRCRVCNASEDEAQFEVHHRTYRNLGNELPEDLTVLCRDCHEGATSMLRARKYALTPPLAIGFIPTALPEPLFDSSYSIGVPLATSAVCFSR